MVHKGWVSGTVGARKDTEDKVSELDGFNSPNVSLPPLVKYLNSGKLYYYVENGKKKEKRYFQGIMEDDVVWEPANGYNRISNYFEKRGYDVFRSDVYRWSKKTQLIKDFRKCKRSDSGAKKGLVIITNPPFKLANEFALKALDLLKPGEMLALLLRTQFVEGTGRYEKLIKDNKPAMMLQFINRLPRMHRFHYKDKKGGTMLAFSWFVWIKGHKGDMMVDWIKWKN